MGPFRLSIVLVCSLSSLVSAKASPPAQQPRQILEQVDARLATDPGNPRLLTIRGAALQALHRDREALDSFSQALTISPKFMAALEGAAQSSYRTHAPNTLAYLNRILKQDPGNSTAHAMVGQIAFERADCGEANRHFAAAGTEASSSATALQHWGQCLVVLGDPHAGSLRLQAASSLAPQDHGILFDYALALFLDARYDSALAVLESNTAKCPDVESESKHLRGAEQASARRLPHSGKLRSWRRRMSRTTSIWLRSVWNINLSM